MGTRIVLAEGWWCWLETPVVSPGWGAGPVWVQQVKPLKTGKGMLRLRFIQAIHPIAARQREVVLWVLYRGADHIVGTIKGDDGTIRSVILAVPDYAWLETYCARLMRRRPPSGPSLIVVGQPPFPDPTAAEHLDSILGHAPEQVLRGATSEGFPYDQVPVTKRHGLFSLDETFDPFDSWMIARGFVPSVMEEKWFIYMEGGRLLFRRSWTGILIYDIEAAWRGDQLYLGQVRVNRDAEQYNETDDDYDRRLLIYLIMVVLLGEKADFPLKENMAPGDAFLQAWSLAGKAAV